MDNTITALKALYEALGGSTSAVADITIIPDMINAIAALIGAGGDARLPDVSPTDNGKALVVSDGEWTVGSALPAVTAVDNGKVLMVANGRWGVSELPS